MTLPYQYWIDSPAGGDVVTPYVLISGWIATHPDVELSDLGLFWGGKVFPLDTIERHDVVRVLSPHHQPHGVSAYGFQGLWAPGDAQQAGDATVRFMLDGVAQEIDVPVRVDASTAADFAAAKVRKAAIIETILRCPGCGGKLAGDSVAGLKCESCDDSFATSNGLFDFLPDSLRQQHHISATTNISAWGYDAKASELIERFRDGLILDCGSGLRPAYLPNVVNYEIAGYPTTDVLGVGQSLPFMDDTFDAVFSFAVLEHVADPFTCARELVRVLKPGGVLFAVVPFLQPFHGFPNHYYNMTSSGLKQLFANDVDIGEIGVPGPGQPIFALTWFLNSYLSGLDPTAAARFAELKVSDLTGDPASYLAQDFVTNLSAAAVEELAATNYIVATKRS